MHSRWLVADAIQNSARPLTPHLNALGGLLTTPQPVAPTVARIEHAGLYTSPRALSTPLPSATPSGSSTSAAAAAAPWHSPEVRAPLKAWR
jgi:hypothetical protein